MIYEFLATGFEEVEAATPVDLLRRAGAQVKQISITGDRCVRGSHGIAFLADGLFEETDFSDAELLILPGGMPGTTNLGNHPGLCELLRAQHAAGKRVAAICAAPMVFGGLGIVNGKTAVCYPGCEDALAGASIGTDVVVTDGNVTTSKGPGTAAAFGLELIRLLFGEAKKKEIGDAFLYGLDRGV